MSKLSRDAGNEAEENSKAAEEVLEVGSNKAASQKPLDAARVGL
jgi:hypothetical protein